MSLLTSIYFGLTRRNRNSIDGIIIVLICLNCGVKLVHSTEDAAFWNNKAQNDIKTKLKEQSNTNVAKNVILFLGDGMGLSTITAARIYKGQQNGQKGEDAELTFEKFPFTGLVKTYNTDQQVPDSAGTATAFLCGVKSKAGTLGVDDNIQYANCSSTKGTEVTSILDWSLTAGKSVGIVTTTRITHATPAAAFSHAASRDWEGDRSLNQNVVQQGCKDIAYQLIMDNPDIQVILGGGRRYLLSVNETDPELRYVSSYQRRDTSLVQEWIEDKKKRNKTYSYTWRKQEFDQINADKTDFVLGLFESSHMQYEDERNKTQEPSLQEMTIKAIEILKRNNNGFFLLVEGGRIDHGHHATFGRRALEETVMFDKAIGSAIEMTSESNTLVVVTADHSHVFMVAGYPTRGNDILGLVDNDIADDGMPYTTLVYGNGPVQRVNLTGVDTRDYDYQQTSAVELSSETHGGEDIPVYARGPMAHLFSGTHEQNYIAHVMAYASCVGQNQEHCKSPISGATTPYTFKYLPCLYFVLTVIFLSIVS